jgi:phosphatidylinositol glycan class M
MEHWRVSVLSPDTDNSPYRRATFRYTPLLPLVLSPTLVHPLFGKFVLLMASLAITPILLSMTSHPVPVHLLWTLNPLVMNITTRGSPEALVVLPVIAFLALLKRRRIAPAGVVWAIAVGWKLYPLIYGPAVWVHLARNGWFGKDVWRFGMAAMGTLFCVNMILWSM